jgi:polysaccharide export outer membrane protein
MSLRNIITPKKFKFLTNAFNFLKFSICSILFVISFYSCVPSTKAVFFPDIREQETYIDSTLFENAKRVFSGDRIQLRIITKDEEANKILNAVLDNQLTAAGVGQVMGYLIDPDGFIEIPTLGKISVRGKTPTEVKELVKNIISDFYKDVEVYCTIGGSVLVFNGAGSTGSASITVPILNERLTLADVLSGINPIYTKIDRIWLIRETDGIRHYIKINMNTTKVFDSPYYFLRNHDIVYLEPYKVNSFIAINSPIRNLIAFVLSIPAIFFGVRTLFVK